MTNPCERLEGWLDEDRPEGRRAEQERHAAGCARCGPRLAAARALSAALRAPPEERAPAGFTEGVMALIRREGRAEAPASRGAAATGQVEPALGGLGRPVWLALGGAWAAAGLALAALAWLAREPLQALAAAQAGGAPDLAGLEAWLAGWVHGAAALPPPLLVHGALAFAAAATLGGVALARLTAALAAPRAPA